MVLSDAPEGLWWLVGVRWGEDSSRALIPTAIMLPDIPATVPATFAEGLGRALGGHWGPQDAPAPPNLPAQWAVAFQNGYQRGVLVRWDGRQSSD